jgi:hypothetical protein
MLYTHKPITDEAAQAMQTRNRVRQEICRRVLGKKHICHPVQHVPRKDAGDVLIHSQEFVEYARSQVNLFAIK